MTSSRIFPHPITGPFVQLIDYPDADIRIYAESEVEKTLRVNCCAKEKETLDWLRTMQPGETFIDIGANVGCYSLIAASRGLQVIAFEPAPFNYNRIKMNAKLNNLRFSVYPLAVSDQPGTCTMNWSSTEPGSALHEMTEGTEISTVSLDDFFSSPPDHVKIDVDGAELKVVQGGMKIWPEVKSVQVEIDDSLPNWEQILKLLTEAGLRIVTWTRHKDTAITTSKVSNVLLRSSSP